MASNVMVAVRIRPFVKNEIVKGCAEVVSKSDGVPQVTVRDKEAFTFNHVFAQTDTQEQVYCDAVEPMIDNLFKGYNITILAYGQTGSGKTYTMGTASNGEEGQNTGVIPRAVREIFEKIQEKQQDIDVTITCSFYELYNEEVFDLLTDAGTSRDKMVRQVIVNKIQNLTEKPVMTPEDCLTCLQTGSQKRTVGATAMNKESSRSHAVYTVNLCIVPKEDGASEITSKFLLVDLAGSERCKKTNATGARMKEGVNINMGLFSLGKVICALCDSKASHIPYRESILTRLLQDSLGGNSYTLMIACVSPADYNIEETNNTLVYANRAKQIKNKPTVNMDPSKQELKNLKAEVERLRLALLNKNPGLVLNNGVETQIDPVEMNRLNNRNNELSKQVHNMLIDLTNVEMRAILAEDVCSEVAQRVDEFKLFILKYFEEKLDDPETLNIINGMFEEIDKIIAQYKNEKNQSISSVNDSSMNENDGEDIKMNFEKHTVKQQDYATKLRDINTALALKEQLHQKIKENCTRLTTYDPEISTVDINKDYLEQIQQLSKELEEMKGQKTEQKSAKLAEERRKKVQELEGKIEILRKKCQQQEKLLKLKAKDGERVKLLDSEIKDMKTSKVKLIRQMRLESDQFRQWRLSKEREIIKMKEVDQKRKLEFIRKESMHQKQQNVLRRKMEEAIATSKRLKEALDKQKSAHAQKNAKHTNFQQMLTQELHVIHSIVDAKMSVKSLMDDRATLNGRLLQLKKRPAENEAEIQNIQQQIELRNAQIADLQTQVISMDVDAKIKEIGEKISNVADYKTAYNTLMKQSVTDREGYIQYKLEMDELRVHAEQLEEDNQAQKALLRTQEIRFEQKVHDTQKHYEEKMSWMLREIDALKKKVSVESLSDTFVIDSNRGVEEALADTMEQLRGELETYKQKCAELNEQLEEKSESKPQKSKKSVQRLSEEVHSDFEFIEETDDEMDDLDDSTLDPEWRKTPLSKRTRRTSSLIRTTFAMPNVPAIRKISEGPNKCACKGTCGTKLCSCQKKGETCGDQCKCDTEKCVNTKLEENENDGDSGSPMNEKSGGNVSRKHSLDEEHEMESTFNVSNTPKKMRMPEMLDVTTPDVTTPVYPYSQKKRKRLLEL